MINASREGDVLDTIAVQEVALLARVSANIYMIQVFELFKFKPTPP